MNQFLDELTDDEDFLELVLQVPRAPKIYRDRIDYFTRCSDKDFRIRFRLSKEVVRFLISEISNEIESNTDR